MDSQIVEMLGRNHLVGELIRSGLEVSLPLRDRGIDLIAYADLISSVPVFRVRPIQMKAASNRSFGLDQATRRLHPGSGVTRYAPLLATTFASTSRSIG
jgi:hypothetical protein